MTFHNRVVRSPPRVHDGSLAAARFQPAPQLQFGARDAAEEADAAKRNDLLNMRSKNIQHILKQREAAGSEFSSTAAITMPAKNPRMEALHKELGIDKTVIVKCPFEIDTTPGGYYRNKANNHLAMPGHNAPGMSAPVVAAPVQRGPRTDATEFSANGNTASAYVDGRLLRGGWAVN